MDGVPFVVYQHKNVTIHEYDANSHDGLSLTIDADEQVCMPNLTYCRSSTVCMQAGSFTIDPALKLRGRIAPQSRHWQVELSLHDRLSIAITIAITVVYCLCTRLIRGVPDVVTSPLPSVESAWANAVHENGRSASWKRRTIASTSTSIQAGDELDR